MKKKRFGWNLVVVVLFGGILFYILNYMTPLYADDYSYSVSFADGQKITSLSDLLASQYRHYFVLNGRVVVHAIAQVFLSIGDSAFNVINTIGFMGLIILVYYHSFGKMKDFCLTWFISIFLGLWFITPHFGQSFLWIVGASNYLYGILIILLFLIPYRKYVNIEPITKKGLLEGIVKSIFMLIGGVIAGWTNENNAVALIVIIVLYMAYYKWLHRPWKSWMVTGGLGSLVGMLGMLLSPSQQARLANNGGTGGIIAMLRRCVLITKDLFIYFLPLFIVLAVFIMLFLKKEKDVKNIKSEFLLPGIYFIGCMVSIYSMVVSPTFPKRTWSGPVVFAIILLGTLFSKLDFKDKTFKLQYNVCLGVLVIGFFASYLDAYLDLKATYVQNEERYKMIREALETGQKEVELPSILSDNKYNCFTYIELSENPEEWPNDDMAYYFGLDKIRLLE